MTKKKLSVSERIEKAKTNIEKNWLEDNNFLGIKRNKLYEYCPGERVYIISRAISELRKKKRMWLNRGRYFYDPTPEVVV